MKGIVIFADSNDSNAQYFFSRVKERGIKSIFMDTKKLSLSYDIYIDLFSDQLGFLWGNCYNYSYFVRAVNLVPLNPFSFSTQEKYSEYRNYYSLMFSFLEILNSKGIKVVNPPSTFWCHYFKPYVYNIAKDIGLDIPITFVTPSFRQLYKAYRNYKNSNKKLVFKPIAGGETVKILDDQNLELLKNSLNVYIFQEFIKGENFRVFTLGDEFHVAFSLIYDCSKSIDYRDLDPSEVKVSTIEVDRDLVKKSFNLAKKIGLYFAGIDFIRNDNGIYFLDINPAPMFVGFEYHSGFPLIDKIIDYLI